jgi:hypothetical protein
MANIICNDRFEKGLRCWSRSDGVEVVDAPLMPGSSVPAARIPSQGYLAQNLEERVPDGDLWFMLFSLGGTEAELDVRIDYSDGSRIDHRLRQEFPPGQLAFRREVPVERDNPLARLRIRNVGSRESGVSLFSLEGDPVRLCLCDRRSARHVNLPWPGMDWLRAHAYPDGFHPYGTPRSMSIAPEGESALASRFLDIEMKLDEILDLLRREQRPPQGKMSKKVATRD